MDRVVVVGAGLAGVRAVAELRERGYGGEGVLLGGETEQPYDRRPLSKAVLAGDAPERLDPHWYAGADLRLGVRASALRPGELETSAGPLGYDGLVLACGSEPLRLPGPGVALRTPDDARRLRGALRPGARGGRVGAGWLRAGGAPGAGAAGGPVGGRGGGWWGRGGAERWGWGWGRRSAGVPRPGTRRAASSCTPGPQCRPSTAVARCWPAASGWPRTPCWSASGCARRPAGWPAPAWTW